MYSRELINGVHNYEYEVTNIKPILWDDEFIARKMLDIKNGFSRWIQE